MNENNTPTNVPFTPSVPSGGSNSGSGPGGGACCGADPGSLLLPLLLPDPPQPYIGKTEDTEENNQLAMKLQRLSKSSLARKLFQEGQEKKVDDEGIITFEGGKLTLCVATACPLELGKSRLSHNAFLLIYFTFIMEVSFRVISDKGIHG